MVKSILTLGGMEDRDRFVVDKTYLALRTGIASLVLLKGLGGRLSGFLWTSRIAQGTTDPRRMSGTPGRGLSPELLRFPIRNGCNGNQRVLVPEPIPRAGPTGTYQEN